MPKRICNCDYCELSAPIIALKKELEDAGRKDRAKSLNALLKYARKMELMVKTLEYELGSKDVGKSRVEGG